MTLYRLTFGLQFDKDGKRLRNVSKKIRTLKERIITRFSGFSYTMGEGGYTDSKGRIIVEKFGRIEISDLYEENDRRDWKQIFIKHVATEIKQILNQESILVEIIALNNLSGLK